MMKRILMLLALLPALCCAQKQTDWAGYGRYEAANAALRGPVAVVFMGNSITELWYEADPAFFEEHNFAARGISGQVTAQMLARFRADVLELRPRAVVILAGTNDIAQNEGPVPLRHIFGNIVSMAELARAHGIDPILCSLLPAARYPWRTDITDVPAKVAALNEMLRDYARDQGLAWVDFFTPMATDDGALDARYTADGIHPLPAGYEVMEQVIAPALAPYIE